MNANSAPTDLTQRPPRSFHVRLGGIVVLPPRLDKGRATLVKKNGEYNATGSGDSLHNGVYAFRIYIAGGAPNSVRALANLNAICRKYFPVSHRIEVIDILKEPMRALAEAIFVTPTVVKRSPAPELHIIGNLSEDEEVLRALGLPQATEP